MMGMAMYLAKRGKPRKGAPFKRQSRQVIRRVCAQVNFCLLLRRLAESEVDHY